MTHSTRRSLLKSAGAVGLAGVAGCLSEEGGAGGEGGALRIGVMQPLTGDVEYYGKQSLWGFLSGLAYKHDADPLDADSAGEEDLVDYANEDSSFMFNFGSGASATVLERGGGRRATVHESAAVTDGSFSRDVVIPGGGTRNPPSEETVSAGAHSLDVPDPEGMKERLAPVSLSNFLDATDRALERSGLVRADVDFVALTHTKRSFYDRFFDELGLDPETDVHYLDDYGHVQSVDQVLALDEGLARGRIDPDDVVCFVGAGTG